MRGALTHGALTQKRRSGITPYIPARASRIPRPQGIRSFCLGVCNVAGSHCRHRRRQTASYIGTANGARSYLEISRDDPYSHLLQWTLEVTLGLVATLQLMQQMPSWHAWHGMAGPQLCTAPQLAGLSKAAPQRTPCEILCCTVYYSMVWVYGVADSYGTYGPRPQGAPWHAWWRLQRLPQVSMLT